MYQEKIIEKLVRLEEWPWEKILLHLFAVLLGSLAIILSSAGVLPLDREHFLFFFFLTFLFCLYRPLWGFFFLVALLPYELITISPSDFGMALRPYQVLVVTLFLALGAHYASGRITKKDFSFQWLDGLLVALFLGALLAVPGALESGVALKQAFVVASFILLYFLVRYFLVRQEIQRETLPFLLTGALPVFGLALFQVVQEQSTLTSTLVMAGRPNATFFEADWLGFYAALFFVFWLGIVLTARAIRTFVIKKEFWYGAIPMGLMIILSYVVLIITISRSAWLASFFGTLILCAGLGYFVFRGYRERKRTLVTLSVTLLMLLGALGMVAFSSLSKFDLSQRAESTATGDQVITIACMESNSGVPSRVESTDELLAYGCRHINLEDKESAREAGDTILEIKRADPNFEIRSDIYAQTREALREHFLLGIGFGNSALILGNDANGTGLNASNLFLELWLGGGLVSLGAFMVLWGVLFLRYTTLTYRGSEKHLIGLAVLVVMTVFNLFNAGMFLAIFFFALAYLVTESEDRIPLDFTPK